MLKDRLKLYKYPVFFVFLSFWFGIFASLWGMYSVVGFVFGAILLRYIFGSDFLYTFLFFIAGYLYMTAMPKYKQNYGRVVAKCTVMRKGLVKVDSIIVGDKTLKGKELRIWHLSGLERGDIILSMMNVKKQGFALVGDPIKIKKTGSKDGFIYKMNRFLKEKIEELSDREEIRGFILGVLIGYRDFISRDLMDDFKRTSTMHILALSGLHIGILISLFYMLFIPLLGHRNRAYLISLGLVFLYMEIVGVTPSILRAYIVFFVMVLTSLLRRKTSFFNVIGISGLFSLILWPSWAFSYSFMLSYLAIFGLVYYNQVLGIKNKYLGVLIASLGAILFTLPITSYLSGYIPLLGFLFNIVVIPLFTICMWLLFGVLIIYIAFPPMSSLLIGFTNAIQGTFLEVIHVFSKISPVLHIKMQEPSSFVFYYLVILIIPVIITMLKERMGGVYESS